MAYKKIFDPPNEEVIYPATDDTPAWTWGDHRDMLKSLRELELDNEQVARARERLDDKLRSVGIDPEQPMDKTHYVCEFCGKHEWITHDQTCPSFDPKDRTVRDAQAYQWMDENFIPLHDTSACANDEEAIDWFRIVAAWFPNDLPMYVLRKEFGEDTFHMIPWKYVDGEVVPIVRSGS